MPWGWSNRGPAEPYLGGNRGTPEEAKVAHAWPRYEAKFLRDRLENGGGKYGAGAGEDANLIYFDKISEDYKSEADENLRLEFTDWLQGKHQANMTPMLYPKSTDAEGGLNGRAPRRAVYREHNETPGQEMSKDWNPTYWGNKQLTHLPGVREHLRDGLEAQNSAEMQMNMLAEHGPQDIEQAWMYFKHWVKGRPVSLERPLYVQFDDGKKNTVNDGKNSLGRRSDFRHQPPGDFPDPNVTTPTQPVDDYYLDFSTPTRQRSVLAAYEGLNGDESDGEVPGFDTGEDGSVLNVPLIGAVRVLAEGARAIIASSSFLGKPPTEPAPRPSDELVPRLGKGKVEDAGPPTSIEVDGQTIEMDALLQITEEVRDDGQDMLSRQQYDNHTVAASLIAMGVTNADYSDAAPEIAALHNLKGTPVYENWLAATKQNTTASTTGFQKWLATNDSNSGFNARIRDLTAKISSPRGDLQGNLAQMTPNQIQTLVIPALVEEPGLANNPHGLQRRIIDMQLDPESQVPVIESVDKLRNAASGPSGSRTGFGDQAYGSQMPRPPNDHQAEPFNYSMLTNVTNALSFASSIISRTSPQRGRVGIRSNRVKPTRLSAGEVVRRAEDDFLVTPLQYMGP